MTCHLGPVLIVCSALGALVAVRRYMSDALAGPFWLFPFALIAPLVLAVLAFAIFTGQSPVTWESLAQPTSAPMLLALFFTQAISTFSLFRRISSASVSDSFVYALISAFGAVFVGVICFALWL